MQRTSPTESVRQITSQAATRPNKSETGPGREMFEIIFFLNFRKLKNALFCLKSPQNQKLSKILKKSNLKLLDFFILCAFWTFSRIFYFWNFLKSFNFFSRLWRTRSLPDLVSTGSGLCCTRVLTFPFSTASVVRVSGGKTHRSKTFHISKNVDLDVVPSFFPRGASLSTRVLEVESLDATLRDPDKPPVSPGKVHRQVTSAEEAGPGWGLQRPTGGFVVAVWASSGHPSPLWTVPHSFSHSRDFRFDGELWVDHRGDLPPETAT